MFGGLDLASVVDQKVEQVVAKEDASLRRRKKKKSRTRSKSLAKGRKTKVRTTTPSAPQSLAQLVCGAATESHTRSRRVHSKGKHHSVRASSAIKARRKKALPRMAHNGTTRVKLMRRPASSPSSKQGRPLHITGTRGTPLGRHTLKSQGTKKLQSTKTRKGLKRTGRKKGAAASRYSLEETDVYEDDFESEEDEKHAGEKKNSTRKPSRPTSRSSNRSVSSREGVRRRSRPSTPVPGDGKATWGTVPKAAGHKNESDHDDSSSSSDDDDEEERKKKKEDTEKKERSEVEGLPEKEGEQNNMDNHKKRSTEDSSDSEDEVDGSNKRGFLPVNEDITIEDNRYTIQLAHEIILQAKKAVEHIHVVSAQMQTMATHGIAPTEEAMLTVNPDRTFHEYEEVTLVSLGIQRHDFMHRVETLMQSLDALCLRYDEDEEKMVYPKWVASEVYLLTKSIGGLVHHDKGFAYNTILGHNAQVVERMLAANKERAALLQDRIRKEHEEAELDAATAARAHTREGEMQSKRREGERSPRSPGKVRPSSQGGHHSRPTSPKPRTFGETYESRQKSLTLSLKHPGHFKHKHGSRYCIAAGLHGHRKESAWDGPESPKTEKKKKKKKIHHSSSKSIL